MTGLTNTIANNILSGLGARVPHDVLSAIKNASLKTGVDFAYMVQQAKAESSFNPEAKAKTSSASGLYQFIESTWLGMVRNHGEKYGLGDLAAKIDAKGRVADKAARREILALRNDPKIASNMAAEFASDNQKFLETHWRNAEGNIGATELYFAHFMGASGAAAFLNARDENPLQQAALLFPKAAAANRSVFYDTKTGRPKTMDEVYAFFDKKFNLKDIVIPELKPEAPKTPEHTGQSMAEALPAVQKGRPAAYGQIAGNNFITSSVFKGGRNAPGIYAANPPAIPRAYQNLLRSPIDLMLLTQLDPPGGPKSKTLF
ncbi:MAG: transglycosylase SLT domain-containing protein [Alphaproteobacteria bacterium]|nr:transglycosylase SLT domain-containing protein [Alphaproteobacteria bacterium]